MSVRHETRRNPETGQVWKRWRVDVVVTLPDGRTKRVNRDAPVQTKRAADKFEQDLRRSILDGTFGKKEEKPVPTVAEFQKEFSTPCVNPVLDGARGRPQTVGRERERAISSRGAAVPARAAAGR